MLIKNEISELIENGKITKAIKIFAEYVSENNEDLLPKVSELKARNKKNRSDKTLEKITQEVYKQKTEELTQDLLSLIEQASEEHLNIEGLDDLLISKKIFLSYNKPEMETANVLKKILMDSGAIDIIDLEKENGKNISEQISKQIEKADVTFLIVSNKKQESTWFALDTINSFYSREKNGKLFVAVYLDSDFLDWRYQMEGVLKLSKRIRELDKTLEDGLLLGDEFLDISTEKERLFKLKDNFNFILNNFKNSAIYDIRGSHLQKNMPKLIKFIKNQQV